jgi:hypothetical protein
MKMSNRVERPAITLLASAALLVGLGGCESSGMTRIAGIGEQGPPGATGAAGPAGPAGPIGATGPAGPAGPTGPSGPPGPGGATGLAGLNGEDGVTGSLAVGGLIGPDGIAGTGLLANTGDPANPPPVVSGVLVTTGEALQGASGQGAILADVVDSRLPGSTNLVGRVISTLDATGQALVRAGNGQDYLIDGLTAAPGQLVNVAIGNARLLGSDETPLLAFSGASPTQGQGAALSAGVASGGQALTLAPTLVAGQAGGAVQGVVDTVTGLLPGQGGSTGAPVQTALADVVGTVTGALDGQSTGGGDTAAANPVQGVVGTVTGLLPGQSGQSDASAGPVQGVVGAVTGLLSGQSGEASTGAAPAQGVGGALGGVTGALGGLLGGRGGN